MRFLQPLEQFARSPPGLGLKPFAQQLRHPREWVGTPTPARRLRLRLAGRAHLAVLPCRAQSGQELLQRRSRRLRRFANDRPVRECNQLLLDFTDRFQQSNRVQCGIRGRCAATDVLVAPRIGQQSLIGRRRGMICFADLRAINTPQPRPGAPCSSRPAVTRPVFQRFLFRACAICRCCSSIGNVFCAKAFSAGS